MMLGAALLTSVLVVGALLIPQGELVTLQSRDIEGVEHSTQLWVVDLENHLYLRAGTQTAGWFLRVRDFPEVGLSRDAKLGSFLAVPVEDAAVRAALNKAMDEKYGVANQFFVWMIDTNAVGVVRLDPRAASAAPAPPSH
jgi:hypothetical protein